ncbi:lipid II flippase MurJ [Amedibacterium intestinale]|uniref:lipid II flippase MurJ n=1 Tax=Amedibacterium intestinale TaxID=2583452 RepID=UPI000E552EB9|nr:lipid II flippase MurJ [Amedibacterium intestinale]RHO21516.1 hypothetical protein DW220_06790 [Eubacterium sp. AM18-26]RHO25680.1 hypothetical protein DW212_06960 [Eubacterium sp. AM18-10LB-B]RHO28130.1 hypothetical protein DW208_09770 [Erysipelotrichaceae bacterium AM17-60]
MNIKTLFRGTAIVSLMVFLAKLISFFSETSLAFALGNGREADIYYSIVSIQQIIYPMISIGVWKIFLPEYKKKIVLKKENESNDLANRIITFFLIVSIGFVIILFLFSKQVTTVIVPGFSKDLKIDVSNFLILTSPMYLFLGISTIYSAMLQARNKFFASQLREIVVQVPVIIASLFLYKKYGLFSLGVALIFGSFLRYIIELPFVDWNYNYKINNNFKDNDFLIFIKRLPSALLTASFTQIHTLIDKMIASLLPSGSISCLNYGSKVTTLILGLFSQAINTAIYPTVASLSAKKEIEKLSTLINLTMTVICFFVIPISFGCIAYNNEIIYILFGRGAFTKNAVDLTGYILAGYSIGLVFNAMLTTTNDILYCNGKVSKTTEISMFSCFLTLITDVIVVKILGAPGLALATSVSNIFTFFIALKCVEKEVGIKVFRINSDFLKIVIASFIAVAMSKISYNLIDLDSIIVKLFLTTLIAIVLYIIIIIILKSKIIIIIKSIIKGEKNEFNKRNKN